MLAVPTCAQRGGKKFEAYCCTQDEDWGEQDAADFAVCFRPCHSSMYYFKVLYFCVIVDSPSEGVDNKACPQLIQGAG